MAKARPPGVEGEPRYAEHLPSLLPLLLLASAPNGDALVRVQTPTATEARVVRDLGLDVWTEAPVGPWLDVRLRPGDRALLDLTGLDYTIRVPDLGPAVTAERLRLSGPVMHGGRSFDSFYDDYRPLDRLDARLDLLFELRPDLVEPIDAGASLEGRPLRAVQITAADEAAPVVLIDAGQHAREWIAIAATTCVAERLVREADTIAPLLERFRFVVLPVVNPDGYVHTWNGDRFWRKNRRPPDGVDLNRNFPVAFGGEGASDNPGAYNYHGAAPFSEPESAAVRDLTDTLGNLAALVDVHSYGQLVLYPWGYQLDPAPDDDTLAPVAQVLADALSAPYDTDYTALSGADLYLAAGNIMDWAYEDHGLFAYSLELRPSLHGPGNGFLLSPTNIIPVCDELYEGVLAVADHIAKTEDSGTDDDSGTSTGAEGTSPDAPGSTTFEPHDPVDAVGSTTGTRFEDSTTDGSAPSEDTVGSDEGCGCTTGGEGGGWMLALPLLLYPHRRRVRLS